MPRRLKQTVEAQRRRARYAEWMADAYLAELLRARGARDREAINADPERLKKRRASRRAYAARQRALVKSGEKKPTPAEIQREREVRRARWVAKQERDGRAMRLGDRPNGRPQLSAAPFRQWLLAYGKLIGETDAGPIAADLGLVSRRVQSVMYEQQPEVAFDIVDRALGNSRHTVTLRINHRSVAIFSVDDLYPAWWKA